MLTIIIPGKTEKYFKKTIEEVLEKATGEIEIYACTDGYSEPLEDRVNDPRVHYINTEPSTGNQKRHLINMAVAQCKGEYVMTLDAHCIVGEGFDEILIRDHQPNWVQIPRRLRLDAENWKVEEDDRLPVDYEYPMWQAWKKGQLKSFRWEARTKERMDIPIDETMAFQGSCYFLTKDYYNKLGLMQTEGYGGFAQESEEIVCKVWADGGKVMTNKNTFYAHLHKGKKHGRMYDLNWEEVKDSIDYSFNFFVNEHRDIYLKKIPQFMPIPNWSEDWQKYLK